MTDTIVELKKTGLSIVVSERNIDFARLVSDRVYLLEKGADAVAQLDTNLCVQKAFLTV